MLYVRSFSYSYSWLLLFVHNESKFQHIYMYHVFQSSNKLFKPVCSTILILFLLSTPFLFQLVLGSSCRVICIWTIYGVVASFDAFSAKRYKSNYYIKDDNKEKQNLFVFWQTSIKLVSHIFLTQTRAHKHRI